MIFYNIENLAKKPKNNDNYSNNNNYNIDILYKLKNKSKKISYKNFNL